MLPAPIVGKHIPNIAGVASAVDCSSPSRAPSGSTPVRGFSFCPGARRLKHRHHEGAATMINSLRTKRLELDLPIEAWAALTGIPASTLSMSDRGTKDLPIERFRQADAMLNELRDLVAFYAPVPIAWKDVAAIRELLDRMRRAKRHTPVDALDLLRELAVNGDDIDAVLVRRNCSPQELIDQLAKARTQLSELTQKLAARNADHELLNSELRKQATL